MKLLLRTIAIAIVGAAIVDPAWPTVRARPLRVDVRTDATPEAASTRQQLAAAIGSDIDLSSGEQPDAMVVIGDAMPDRLPERLPISTISLAPDIAPNVRLVSVSAPSVVVPGQDADVIAVVEGTGVAGRTSVIVLEQHDVELARVEHRWLSSPERFAARLRYAPPASGVTIARVTVRPLDDETTAVDNIGDVALTTTSRALRVLAYDSRPSWIAGFVRRALESDNAFEVASLVRPSRGREVSAGAAPERLTAASLATFDAAIVGAPEDLTSAEVDALDAFSRVRGGAVILLPDRRPAGNYLRLLRATRFDEVLLEQPVALGGADGSGLRASELSLPFGIGGGGEAIATFAQHGDERPVIVSWPRGAGRIVFSGALDAWRYRARDNDAFARAWTGTIASLAMAAPPGLSLRLQPAAAAPGDRIVARAHVRQTAFQHRNGTTVVPALDASITTADGSSRALRLWPSSEAGAFEATLTVPRSGRYDVHVSMDGGRADATLVVDQSVRHMPAIDEDTSRMVSATTGGVHLAARDLDPLRAHLRTLPRNRMTVEVRPMRSLWWLPILTAVLCGEWGLRRRSGLS